MHLSFDGRRENGCVGTITGFGRPNDDEAG
jgi:hypothetical protein